MTPETEKKIRDLADHLRGSCTNLTEEDQELIEESDQSLALFDQLVFCCSSCDWWCGEDEYGKKDGECNECSPDEDEDDGFQDDDDDADSEDDSGDDSDEDG